MLGVADRRNKNTVSIGSAAGIPGASMALLGEAQLTNFYNDGNKGTGGGLGRGGRGGGVQLPVALACCRPSPS